MPELADLPATAIHGLATQRPLGVDSPPPIVDHRRERRRAEMRYRLALGLGESRSSRATGGR